VLDLPARRRRRCAAEIGLRVAALSPARRVGADSQRRVPGGKKRSSCFTATRTHWEERAAASSLRPISTCGLRAACAGAGDPAGRARLKRTLGRRSGASMPDGMVAAEFPETLARSSSLWMRY